MSGHVSYRDVLRNREFAGMIAAQAVSEVGDQLARLALAFVVLDRTGSALGAAAAFAVSFLPVFLGSAVLGPLADRLSRRSVMLVADAGRAVLIAFFALVAVSTTPLWLMFLLLFFAELFTPAFDAARTSSIPDVLPEPAEASAAFGLSRTVSLGSQVVGLVVGGAVIGLLGARLGLVIDALTFVVSFIVLLVLVRRRPAPMEGGASLVTLIRDSREGLHQLRHDRGRRSLLMLALAGSLAVVAPEALALSYARDAGAADLAAGALLACVVGGAAVGSVMVSRQRPARQVELLLPLALACGLVLLVAAPAPSLLIMMPLFIATGLLQAFLVPCMAFMTLLTPAEQRGRIAGLSASAWALGTVVSFLVAGAIADATSPAFSIVLCASLSLVLILATTLRWPGRELRHRVLRLSATQERPSPAVEAAVADDLRHIESEDSGVMKR